MTEAKRKLDFTTDMSTGLQSIELRGQFARCLGLVRPGACGFIPVTPTPSITSS